MARWSHLLTDRVTVATENGLSGYGDPMFGAQTTLPARVEKRAQLVRTPEGNELQADSVVVTETEIPTTSRLWLPGDDTNSQAAARRIIATKAASIPGGAGLFEAYL